MIFTSAARSAEEEISSDAFIDCCDSTGGEEIGSGVGLSDIVLFCAVFIGEVVDVSDVETVVVETVFALNILPIGI